MRQDERGDAVAAVRRSIREALVRLAGDLGEAGTLEPVGEGGQAWRLRPARNDAAAVVWDEAGTDDWAAPLNLGAATEVHVLIDPTLPAEAAGQTVTTIVAAVTAGRFREELWISRRTGRIVAAVGWLRDPGSSRWRAIGNRTRPVPVVRALRHDRRVRDYAAYDPPL